MSGMKDRRTGLFNLASSTSRMWQLLGGRGAKIGEEGEVGVEKYLAPHENCVRCIWNWNMVEWECGQLTNAHIHCYVYPGTGTWWNGNVAS